MMKHEDESEIELTSGSTERQVQEQLIPSSRAGDHGAAKKRAGGFKKPLGAARDPTKPRKTRRKSDENAMAVLIKYAALILLVAQMVGLVLIMRYSRTNHKEEEPLYLASTAVFVMEVMKLVICCLVIAYQSGGNLFSELNEHVVHSPMEMLKLTVPSFLYTGKSIYIYIYI
jgi:hypothetical protein